MIVFWSLVFLGLVTMIAGPWVALVAFIVLVVYGVTDTARKAPPARTGPVFLWFITTVARQADGE
jgi:hypothetical protein